MSALVDVPYDPFEPVTGAWRGPGAGARLTIFPTGGHIWLGHDSELFGQIDGFLKDIGYA